MNIWMPNRLQGMQNLKIFGKVRSSPDEIKSEIAKKKWYDEIKLQNEHVKNKVEASLVTKKKRIWIYALAGIVLTIGFSLVMPITHGSDGSAILNNVKGGQSFDWNNMLGNPQSTYCDPPHGEQNRYCFYQNALLCF
jgi:hypothetical protein